MTSPLSSGQVKAGDVGVGWLATLLVVAETVTLLALLAGLAAVVITVVVATLACA